MEIFRYGDSFSPKLIHPHDLQKALEVHPHDLQKELEDIEIKALGVGFQLISSSLPHLLEMETNKVAHYGGEVNDIIVHVPAFAIDSEVEAHELLPIPIPIFPIAPNDGNTETQNWIVENSCKLIVANIKKSIYYDISKEGSGRCTKIEKRFYCENLL